jgi:hypothetical protein
VRQKKEKERSNSVSYDKNSFRAVDFYRADFEAMNDQLVDVNWVDLIDICGEDESGSEFLEPFRLKVLRITLLHSPPKDIADQCPTLTRKNR